MLNFNRDSAKSPDKLAAKPAPYPYAPVPSAASGAPAKTPASALRPGRDPPRPADAPVLTSALPDVRAR